MEIVAGLALFVLAFALWVQRQGTKDALTAIESWREKSDERFMATIADQQRQVDARQQANDARLVQIVAQIQDVADRRHGDMLDRVLGAASMKFEGAKRLQETISAHTEPLAAAQERKVHEEAAARAEKLYKTAYEVEHDDWEEPEGSVLSKTDLMEALIDAEEQTKASLADVRAAEAAMDAEDEAEAALDAAQAEDDV